MTFLIVLISIIIVSLIAQAFFAASEMAMISSDYIRLKNTADNGDPNSEQVIYFLERPQLLFGTTLLGVNVAIVLNSASASYLIGRLCDHYKWDFSLQMQGIITTAIMLPLILFFGEIIPMGFSRLNPTWFRLYGIKLFKALFILLYPGIIVTSFISSLVSRLLHTEDEHASLITRDELEAYITNSFAARDSKSYPISIERIIRETFDFSRTTAAQIMIPLIKIEIIDEKETAERVRALAVEHGYSRIPVFRGRSDNIIGYINVMDFITAEDTAPIADKVKKPFLAPEQTPLPHMLPQMIKQRKHIAFLVNEFGGITGMISDEDAFEDILGHIYDEYDPVDRGRKSGDIIEVHGDIPVHELNKQYGLSIPESEDYETLAGYILTALNKIPDKGTVIPIGDYTFRITKASDRRITTIAITPPAIDSGNNDS